MGTPSAEVSVSIRSERLSRIGLGEGHRLAALVLTRT